MNNKILIIFYFMSGLGLVTLGTIIHEGVHLLQSKEPRSICYDLGQKTVAHIESENIRSGTEYWAYTIQIIFIIIGLTILSIITLKEKNNE